MTATRAMPTVHENPPHPLAGFFEPLRRQRREHYASPARRKRPARRAVQTIVHDEPVFFPIWLGYYGRFFEPGDIYVLDNETTDGSTSGAGFVRIPVAHDRVDHAWMARTLADHQRDLLNRYDAVLTVDVDEIVAPAPELADLGAYLDRFDEEFVNCLGYEIIHMRDREPPLRPALPLLGQRGHWFANDAYDKPALATEPTEWVPGLHTLAGRPRMNVDPDLRLIHLHRVDYELCRERHRLRRDRAWNRHDLDAGWATHNRLTGGDEFDRWFYEDSCYPGIEIAVERIPAAWRGLF